MQRLLSPSVAAFSCVSLYKKGANASSTSTTNVSAVTSTSRAYFRTTAPNRGLEQIIDVPKSAPRAPTGRHAGPNKRVANVGETEQYKFIKRWELMMSETWDPMESFKGQPKPKKQFGNEMTEVIWPYALLLENPIHIHRFTKSIYVYYPQKNETHAGAFAAAVAKRFSHQYLIPITFHNSQVYVETEMLIEYGEVPWVVIHCLDGRHVILPVKCDTPALNSSAESSSASNGSEDSAASSSPSSSSRSAPSSSSASGGPAKEGFSPIDIKSATEKLLNEVLAKAAELGESVSDIPAAITALHDRPLQNQYVRVNYQWYGENAEDRATHLVTWNYDPEKVVPATRFKHSEIRDRLNFDGGYPSAPAALNAARVQKHRIVKGQRDGSGLHGLQRGQAQRQSAKYSRAGGAGGQKM